MSITLRPRDMSAHPKSVEDENGAGHATSGGGISDSVTYHFTAHDHKGRHIGKVSVNDGFGRDNEFKVKFAPKGAKGAAAKGTDITHAIPQADQFDIDRSYTGNNADHAYDHGVAAITGYLGKPARKRDNFKIESTETQKKSLIESAAKLISQQSEMSEMGNRRLQEDENLRKQADHKLMHSVAVKTLADVRKKHAAAAQGIADRKQRLPNEREQKNPHDSAIHAAFNNVQKHKDAFVAAGGNVKDLGESTALSEMRNKPFPPVPSMSSSEHVADSDGYSAGKDGKTKLTDNPHPKGSSEHAVWHKAFTKSKSSGSDKKYDHMKNSVELEGNPLTESSDDTDHEKEFRNSFDRHLNLLNLSNNEPNEKRKGKLRTLSQIELNAAHGHAQLHWMRKGKSIHVGTSSKYDEYISSLQSPLVTKFR